MKKHSNLIARFCVLAILLTSLWYVLLSPQTQVVHAYRCCETCPGSYPGDPSDCEWQCGSDEACFQSCMAHQNTCWYSCRFCDGGGGECNGSIPCDPSYTCVNGYCVAF